MAQQIISIGAAPSDGTGDPLRISFDKINDNFTELYSGNIATPGGNVVIGSGQVTSVAGKIGAVVLTVDNIIGAVSQNYVDNKLGELVFDTINDQIVDLTSASPQIIVDMRQLADAIQNDSGYYMSITTQLSDKVSKTMGGTMTAPLILRGTTSLANEAASKQYVDDKAAATLQTVTSELQINNVVLTGLALQVEQLPTFAAYTQLQANVSALSSSVYTKAEIDAILLNITSSEDGGDDWGSLITDTDNNWGSVAEPATLTEDFGSIL